jgi:hypothetical protein
VPPSITYSVPVMKAARGGSSGDEHPHPCLAQPRDGAGADVTLAGFAGRFARLGAEAALALHPSAAVHASAPEAASRSDRPGNGATDVTDARPLGAARV